MFRGYLKPFFVLVLFFVGCQISAQTTDTTITNLNEVVITTLKFPEKRKRVAQSTLNVTNKSLLNFQPNTADALTNTGAVFVQKSQQGGGSPVIRGFEASRVLLLVDGVRLNNAIYRTGHLQNIITIDNMVLDKLEVLYGPSSTLYGSDALGGVINMFTKNPQLATKNNKEFWGNATFRVSTAVQEGRTNVQFNIGRKKWASFTSITYGKFGDAVQGSNRRDAYTNFGKKLFVVQQINNTDSAIINSNPNVQNPSNYSQIDITQKVLFQPNAQTKHLLNIQLSNSSNIPRYDRLSELNAGNPAFAEWYYGPQKRNLVAYSFNKQKEKGYFNLLSFVANYQQIHESRITRRFKSNNRDSRWENVNILGFTVDAKHIGKKQEIHIGIENYLNFVSSTAQRLNINMATISRIQTRYADGPTSMNSFGIYAQHTYKVNEAITFNSGVRLNHIALNANFIDTSFVPFPLATVHQQNFAITGNVGFIYAKSNSKLAILLNSGFRNPNVDDLSKVFETNIGRVVVPNVNVKPEYTYNAEISYNYFTDKFSFGSAVFYTFFTNAIVVSNFKFKGADSILYNGVNSVVVAPQNKATAFITGFSANASLSILANTTIEGLYNYTYGRYKNEGIIVPLDHIPPSYGKVALVFKKPIWRAEIFSMFNGWKRLEDYSPSGEDNLQFATVDGMPSWITLNAKLAFQLKKVALQTSIENIFDVHYRYFASGISAPGRNFTISIRCNF